MYSIQIASDYDFLERFALHYQSHILIFDHTQKGYLKSIQYPYHLTTKIQLLSFPFTHR